MTTRHAGAAPGHPGVARRHSRTAAIGVVGALAMAATLVAVPADAATGKLTVTAITRSGQPTSSGATAINLSTGKTYRLDAGTATALPTGTYVVGSYINDYPALTVAARTVKVGKSAKVTFDTRKAKKVTFNVGDRSVRPVDLAVVPFVKVKGKEQAFIVAHGQEWPAANTYVLPGAADGVRLGIHGVLGTEDAQAPVRYDLAYSLPGMPSKVRFAVQRSQLAKVVLNVATLDPLHRSRMALTALSPTLRPITGIEVGTPVLGKQISYRTPGLQWRSTLTMNDLENSAFLTEAKKAKKLLYAAGRAYREEWGLGVWGPRPASPAIFSQDGQLHVLGGPPICAFSGSGVSLTDCQLQPQTVTYTLKGNKNLGKGEAVIARIDASQPQWYTATMTANRGGDAAGLRAGRVEARWYFQAGGTFRRETETKIITGENRVRPGYIRIVPRGADERNSVAAGSPTTLVMSVLDFGKVAAMTLQYSTDGGKSWKKAKVANKGAAFLATVPAPQGADAVSLRAVAKGPSGAFVEYTVINAYGVRG